MPHPADFIPAIDRVLAEIKGNRDKARVAELQREYRKLSRAYEQAAIAVRALVPLAPVVVSQP